MIKSFWVGVVGGLWMASAHAQLACDKSYGFRADVGSAAGQTLCGSRVDTFIDAAERFNLSNTGYTPTSAAMVQGRISDVAVTLRYDAATTVLNYNFPQLGMSGSFNGGTRDISEQQFVDFLKKSDIIGRIMRYQALTSPSSPLTGLGGAIPLAGAADFAQGFDVASQMAVPGDQGGGHNNLLGVGLSYGSFNINSSGDRIKPISIPLSYTVRSNADPRRQLVFSVPLSLVRIGDADVYQGGVGLAYRVPVTSRWTLAPGARFNVVGSKDRATVSTVMSGSLMSTYVIPADRYAVAIGNMVAHYRTGKVSSGDYSFDPDISLTMVRNGALLSVPTNRLGGGKMAVELSLIDTRYVGGDRPYVSNSQEVGLTMGTNRNGENARSFLRAGVSYVHAKDTKGFTVNLGYWF